MKLTIDIDEYTERAIVDNYLGAFGIDNPTEGQKHEVVFCAVMDILDRYLNVEHFDPELIDPAELEGL